MSAITASELQQRLSEQLQALSQVGESLTLRLLELEERLGGLEEQLQELQLGDLSQEDRAGETQELLAATEERIGRLEDLLSLQSQTGRRARLEPVPLQRPRTIHEPGSPDEEPGQEQLHPCLDDEPQPFMDELSA